MVKEREREREREKRETDSFKKCLSPRCNTKPPLLIRLSRKRGRERWHKWLQESACTPLQDRVLEVQQRRGVPSRKHKTGTTVLVLTSHLPSATSKSTDLTDQASFPSTDTVITTKKKKKNLSSRWTKSSTRACAPVDLLHDEGRSRASWSCAIFLLAPQPDRARVTMMCTRTRASSPRRHFVSSCARSDIPHLSTFTWNGPLCAVLQWIPFLMFFFFVWKNKIARLSDSLQIFRRASLWSHLFPTGVNEILSPKNNGFFEHPALFATLFRSVRVEN